MSRLNGVVKSAKKKARTKSNIDGDVTTWTLEKQFERVLRQRNELLKIIGQLDLMLFEAQGSETPEDRAEFETSARGCDLIIRIANPWKNRTQFVYKNVARAAKKADAIVGNLYLNEGYNPETGDTLSNEGSNVYRKIAEKYTKPWE